MRIMALKPLRRKILLCSSKDILIEVIRPQLLYQRIPCAGEKHLLPNIGMVRDIGDAYERWLDRSSSFAAEDDICCLRGCSERVKLRKIGLEATMLGEGLLRDE